MAFDSGMVACVSDELSRLLDGGKVEKIFQPEKDEINILIHSLGRKYRLLITTGSNCPRVCVTDNNKENPSVPPMLCMLLRKHLQGGRLKSVRQIGFDRVVEFCFSSNDEMGFESEKRIYAELMGRNSNTVFCDGEGKVLSSFRVSDVSSRSSRTLLPGVKYELPPAQEKTDPLTISEAVFNDLLDSQSDDTPVSKFLCDKILGLSPLTAREVAYRASGSVDTVCSEITRNRLWNCFTNLINLIKNKDYSPCLLYKTGEKVPFEYSFFDINQYGSSVNVRHFDSASRAIDIYFTERDTAERKKQHINDISTFLKNAENRLRKKVSLQENELLDCEKAADYKKMGDIITQEMYRIGRKDRFIRGIDYSDESMPTITVDLDPRLTPSQNAQRYYKEYNKKKNAKKYLTEQIIEAKKELSYVSSVYDALSRASSDSELFEIRDELSQWGYGKRNKSSIKKKDIKKKYNILTDITPNGYKLLIGKNNLQNDYITCTLADRDDYWFHIKNYPGSHVVMVTGGEEPPAEDFTYAATVAAKNSSADPNSQIEVDYTKARYIKKPSGSKPGFVTYEKYWSANIKL